MDEIHNRMPVVLELDDVDTWLNVDEHPPDERSSSTPAGSKRDALSITQLGLEVGNVKNDGRASHRAVS